MSFGKVCLSPKGRFSKIQSHFTAEYIGYSKSCIVSYLKPCPSSVNNASGNKDKIMNFKSCLGPDKIVVIVSL